MNQQRLEEIEAAWNLARQGDEMDAGNWAGDYADTLLSLTRAQAAEIERLRAALENLVLLAKVAMREANRDGAEYDVVAELLEARAALARLEEQS